MNRPLLIGETVPAGRNLGYVLWPSPKGSAGWRLCFNILQLSTLEYFNRFDRDVLCIGEWNLDHARERFRVIRAQREGPLVLLGRRVTEAASLPFVPFTTQISLLSDRDVYILPHPSGRSEDWNELNFERARDLLRKFLAD